MSFRFSAILSCFFLICCTVSGALAAEKSSFPKILATVNGQPIPYSALKDTVRESIRKWEKQNGKQADAKIVRKLVARALYNKIQETVIEQECEKYMIDVTDDAVNRQLEQLIIMSGGKKKFEEQLKRANLSMDQVRARVRRSLATQELIRMNLSGKIDVTDKEIKEYYEHNRKRFITPPTVDVSHIVIELAPNAPPKAVASARKKAEEILQKLRNGADFAEMAKKYSSDPSRLEGGHLGVLKPGFMPPAFDKVAFSLKPGEIGGPVRTPHGFHIIKANKVTPKRVITLEKAKPGIEVVLKRSKYSWEEKQYLRKLMDNAKIHIFL